MNRVIFLVATAAAAFPRERGRSGSFLFETSFNFPAVKLFYPPLLLLALS